MDAHAAAKGFGGSDLRTPTFGEQLALKAFSIESIEVTNGKCEIGFSSNANANQWINIDDVRLERVSD